MPRTMWWTMYEFLNENQIPHEVRDLREAVVTEQGINYLDTSSALLVNSRALLPKTRRPENPGYGVFMGSAGGHFRRPTVVGSWTTGRLHRARTSELMTYGPERRTGPNHRGSRGRWTSSPEARAGIDPRGIQQDPESQQWWMARRARFVAVWAVARLGCHGPYGRGINAVYRAWPLIAPSRRQGEEWGVLCRKGNPLSEEIYEGWQPGRLGWK